MHRFLGLLLLIAGLAALVWISGVDQPLREDVRAFAERGPQDRSTALVVIAAGTGLAGLILALSPRRR